MKRFHYDALLNEEDICNLLKEKERIKKGLLKKEKMIIYGRRNTGKTSLVKNVIIPHFKKSNKESFVLFADLMQVKDLSSLSKRIRIGFEEAFKRSFPAKAFIENAKKFLKDLRPVLSIDPLSGSPTIELKSIDGSSKINFQKLFEIINSKIAPKMPVLIVLDEFQDISLVDEAPGLIRASLQNIKDYPIVLMGSKKHLLANMFAKPNAPFADFGCDIEFGPIPYGEYYEYIMERLKLNKIKLSLEVAKTWQDILYRNPEAINIVGAHIVEKFHNVELKEIDIQNSINEVVEERSSRYEEIIANLSINEEDVLVAIAKLGPIKEPTGKDFLKKVKPSHGTVTYAIQTLTNNSFLEHTPNGYMLSSPLLCYFLKRYR